MCDDDNDKVGAVCRRDKNNKFIEGLGLFFFFFFLSFFFLPLFFFLKNYHIINYFNDNFVKKQQKVCGVCSLFVKIVIKTLALVLQPDNVSLRRQRWKKKKKTHARTHKLKDYTKTTI